MNRIVTICLITMILQLWPIKMILRSETAEECAVKLLHYKKIKYIVLILLYLIFVFGVLHMLVIPIIFVQEPLWSKSINFSLNLLEILLIFLTLWITLSLILFLLTLGKNRPSLPLIILTVSLAIFELYSLLFYIYTSL